MALPMSALDALSPRERSRFVRNQGIMLPDGGVWRNGVKTSPADIARAQADTARIAALDAQTAASRAPAQAAAREVSRLAPSGGMAALATPNQPGQTTISPEQDFMATQALREAQRSGMLPDRDYSDDALNRATPAQRIAEAARLEELKKNRGQMALLGQSPSASPAVAAPIVMPDQAAANIPGTNVPAPAGASMADLGDGRILVRGQTGGQQIFNASDTEAIQAWAGTQPARGFNQPSAGAAVTAFAPRQSMSDFARETADIRQNQARAVALGVEPGVAAAAANAQIEALDPDGSRRAEAERAIKVADAKAVGAVDEDLRNRLGDAAAKRQIDTRIATQKALQELEDAYAERNAPRIQKAMDTVNQGYTEMVRLEDERLDAIITQVGAPVISAAEAAKQAIEASARTMRGPERDAASQAALALQNAINARDPVAAAGLLNGLSGTYSLQIGPGAAEATAAFAEQQSAARSIVERNKADLRRNYLGRIDDLAKASGYRTVAPTGTMGGLADAPAVPGVPAVPASTEDPGTNAVAAPRPAATPAAAPAQAATSASLGSFAVDTPLDFGTVNINPPAAPAAGPVTPEEAYAASGYRGTFEQWLALQRRRARPGLAEFAGDFFRRASDGAARR